MRTKQILFIASVLVSATLTQTGIAREQDDPISRGAYLVNGPGACGNCHTQRGADLLPRPDMFLAGGYKFDRPLFVAFAKNITPDKDTGIGSWTDAQLIRAIREGVTKEGVTLGPPMPVEYYNKLSDEDVKAMVAYLRTVKPVHNAVPESKYKIPLKPEHPAAGAAAPPKTDKVAHGKYIADIAHCLECHTPQVGPKRDYENQLGAGGFDFIIGGKKVLSRNITSDKETGLGDWTDDQIKRAITDGIDRDGKKLIPQMPYPYFKRMTAEDVDAVVAFLRTLPAIKKKIEPNPSLEAFLK